MSLTVIFSIIFIHWVADFVFQTRWQAVNKSHNNLALTAHVGVYSLVWLLLSIVMAYFTNNNLILLFAPVTFVCHWATDYTTSRVNGYFWQKNDLHNFFVSIGFDQVLHYVQLFLTYYILTK